MAEQSESIKKAVVTLRELSRRRKNMPAVRGQRALSDGLAEFPENKSGKRKNRRRERRRSAESTKSNSGVD